MNTHHECYDLASQSPVLLLLRHCYMTLVAEHVYVPASTSTAQCTCQLHILVNAT